jgi:DNA-binding MarR family transcriptional regulator
MSRLREDPDEPDGGIAHGSSREGMAGDDDMYSAAAALRQALRTFQRRSEQIARANGLTERTYQLLLMIKAGREASGRASLRELEQRLQLGKSTVIELVLRAEDRELVRRELDRRRRREIVVRLTPEGERRLACAFAELGDERARLVELFAD